MMKCKFVTLLLITTQAVVLAVHARPAFASVIGGPIINPANDHSYYLLDFSSWTDAETEAISLSGHLVTINDEDENVWVTETFGNFEGVNYVLLWIGLNDAENEGTFVWASGDSVTYTNWHAGEPNAAFQGEDYGHINITFGNGEWVDRRDSDGNRLFGVVEVPFDVTTSVESKLDGVPTHTALHQNYPNPFNPTTNIKFSLSQRGYVTLTVYDVTGREIAKLVDAVLSAGQHQVSFDGQGFSSGVYFYRLRSGRYIESKRFVLLR